MGATSSERRAHGRDLRSMLPRGAHADLVVPDRDPVDILEDQNRTRIADLVPLRIGRMLQSPFAFYRGTAGLMAHDLAANPTTGQQLVCCGDAHIANFGVYASAERRLVFDLNDFDEASNAPWEWDVKRLAASIVIGARHNGIPETRCREIAEAAVHNYRVGLQRLLEMTTLERYYVQVETDWLEALEGVSLDLLRRTVRRARRRTSHQAFNKLTTVDGDGNRRIREVASTTRHVDYVSPEQLAALIEQYRQTLRADIGLLLAQFSVVDVALRVVGVGSVGTRCYVVLLLGPAGEPLVLQVKEAPPSVLETYGGCPSRLDLLPPVELGKQGYRVVSGQRILQASSDPFLGWIGGWSRGGTDAPADFYVRQFRDMKGSVETEELTEPEYAGYVSLCALLLARGHSQSAAAPTVAGYIGRSARFEKAVAAWSVAYADQAERDYAALEAAVRSGRLAAERGA